MPQAEPLFSRILVVDDDLATQEIAKALLKNHQIEVDTVFHVNQALELMTLHTYDVVIIDLTLPDIDGWQLLKSIRRNPKYAHTPCVAITAYHSPAVAQEALKADFTAYFSKPLDVYTFYNDLIHALEAD